MQDSLFSCLKKTGMLQLYYGKSTMCYKLTFSSYLSDFNSIWIYIFKWWRADVAKFVSCLDSKGSVNTLLNFEQSTMAPEVRSTFQNDTLGWVNSSWIWEQRNGLCSELLLFIFLPYQKQEWFSGSNWEFWITCHRLRISFTMQF